VGGELVIGDPNPQLPPRVDKAAEVTLNFVEQDLYTLLDFFARTTRRNFVIADKKELEGKKVTVISHHPIPADLAWQAFTAALEASGYTTYESGGNWYRIVKLGEAGSKPISVGVGKGVAATESFVTQLITLENVNVSEVSKVIDAMKSQEGRIVAYAPTNTMIITDTGSNIRKMMRVMEQLDVAAPRASLAIIPLKYADAADVRHGRDR
jgi:general secretion pathway protein D